MTFSSSRSLIQALSANPNSGPVEHALGLSLIRQKRTVEGVASLAAAAQDSPNDPHLSYVFAVALHETDKTSDALTTLKSALVHHPYDREILWALAVYEAQSGDLASAVARMNLLSQLEPDRADISQALENLKRLAASPP